MVKENSVRLLGCMLAVVIAGFGYGVSVSAERYTSPNYTIDASVLGNSFGGTTTSANYQLTSAGGESVVGQGSGGSYKLDSGYVAQLADQPNTFTMSLQKTGLIGYFSFDNYKEGSTTVENDAGMVSRDLNVSGVPFQPVTGKVGTAVSLGGNSYADDNNEGGQGAYVIAPGSVMTFTGWINSQTSEVRRPFLWNNWNCVGWVLEINPQDLLGVSYVGGNSCSTQTGYPSIVSNAPIADGTWHYFAGIINRNSGVMKMYVDGVFHSSIGNIDTTTTNPSTARMRIGANWDASENLTGQLDEIKIYSRELGEQEIKAEYEAQNVGISSGMSLGTITPNTSNTAMLDTIVDTNTTSYSLAISQDKNLTSQMSTIPAISSTITSPSAWAEGSTKGLGFSLVSANAQAIDTKWNAGSSYAAIPGTATTVYNRSGNQHPAKDTLTMRLRADVAASQPMGAYSNVVTMTGTYLP